MRWFVDLFRRFQRQDPPPPPVIDREALREEMTRTDPDFRHVREAQHEAIGLIGASRSAEQLRDRYNERLRESWRPR